MQQENERMSINIRLKHILEIKKLNIKNFSEKADLTYRTAQNYLSGDRKPDTEGLLKISTHLGVNLNWLITGIGTPFIEEQDTKTELSESTSGSLTPDEQSLLDDYRYSSETGKQAISTVAKAVEKQIQIEAGKVG